MRSFRDHDEIEYKKLVDWQRQVKTRSANKEKPERPDVSFWFPPAFFVVSCIEVTGYCKLELNEDSFTTGTDTEDAN